MSKPACKIHHIEMQDNGFERGYRIYKCEKCIQDKKRKKPESHPVIHSIFLLLFVLVLIGSVSAGTWLSNFNDGLQVYYTFNESTGVLFKDSLGVHNITLENRHNTTGIINNSYGSTTATLGNSTGVTIGTATINVWLRQAGTTNDQPILSSKSAGVNEDGAINIICATTGGGNWDFYRVGNDGIVRILRQPYGVGWQMITITLSATNTKFYSNGTLIASNSTIRSLTNTNPLFIARYFDNAVSCSGIEMDEMGVWNRVLTANEISNLYNSHNGVTYAPPKIVNTIPATESSLFTSTPITFGCNTTFNYVGNITSMTLNVNGTTSGTYNWTQTITGLNVPQYNATFTNSTLLKGNYNWNCLVTGKIENTTSDIWNFSFSNLIVNTQTYNITSYETATENFILNITTDGTQTPTAIFYYNGTAYTSTISGASPNYVFTRSLTLTSVGNKNLIWSVNYGSSNINATTVQQNVNSINFQICNTTLNVPFINITFQDESTLTAINGSVDTSTWIYYLGNGASNKTLIYINTSVNNPSYAFCFSPADKTLHTIETMQYSFTGYPQRRWDASGDLTNTTTNKILYLLSSSVGIYSIYSVQNQFGTPIQGVEVTAQRLINGVYYTVEQGITDTAGTVTFWLNPNFDHSLSFVKSGYTSQTVTVRPSSSTYVVTMSDSSENSGNFNSSLEGITWKYYTNSTTVNLLSNTVYRFTANFSANFSNIVSCRIRLLDNVSNILGTATGCSSTGGSIYLDQNTGTYRNIRMEISLDLGEGYQVLDTDAYWSMMDLNIPTRGTIKSFFLYSRDLSQWGGGNRGEFSKVLLFFIILFCILAWVSANTNYDFITSGGAIMLLMPIVWIASMAGFFNLTYLPDTRNFPIVGYVGSFMNKYTIALLASCFSLGYWFNNQAAKGG